MPELNRPTRSLLNLAAACVILPGMLLPTAAVAESTLEVASSKTRIGASLRIARAIEIR